jgi:hypothetical protein
MSIKQQLLTAFPGLVERDFATHCSDLYVVFSPEVHEFLSKLKPKPTLKLFSSQAGSDWNGAGLLCIEIVFGYMDEFVAEREAKRKGNHGKMDG